MDTDNKIKLVCVGGAGGSFFQFLENGRGKELISNTLLLDVSYGNKGQVEVCSDNFAHLVFCVLGAASTNNILKTKAFFDHNPILWRKTHFIIIHPFNFEGKDKAQKAKEFSEFVTCQGSEKTDFSNQDLFKHIDKDAKFEDGFEIMNQWILHSIEQ